MLPKTNAYVRSYDGETKLIVSLLKMINSWKNM